MIPRHLGIIMDGNGRWAEAHGLPRQEGYKAGLLALKKIIAYSITRNIDILTVYAFSTENWKRPNEEINAIFDAIQSFCSSPTNMCSISFCGNLENLPDKLKKTAEEITRKRKTNDKILLNIAINYGGRADIVNAVNKILSSQSLSKIDESTFASYLSNSKLPSVDAIIRTGGEKRLSNFLLYESAYSELVFVDTLWPDFDESELDRILYELQRRTQKFGGAYV
ncbi:MAG: polyprenyl diphosphate synthase [Clostridia bacterium]|nr:polyprenyl diphosphate synthase [Clostridia bacterium]